MLRGKVNKIIAPDGADRENNLQKLVRLNNKKMSALLKTTLNTTFQDLATAARNTPKTFLRNVICLAPDLMLIAREKQDPTKRVQLKEQLKDLLKIPGKQI